MSDAQAGLAEVVVALAIIAGAILVGYVFNWLVGIGIIVVAGGLWIGWLLQRRSKPSPDEE